MVDNKNFLPISLVGDVYKMISKVLTYKLKSVLKKVISNSQNALISIFIANECLDSKIRLRNLSVLCKLELEKAYDYVNWDFLLYLLRRCGFGEQWRE